MTGEYQDLVRQQTVVQTCEDQVNGRCKVVGDF